MIVKSNLADVILWDDAAADLVTVQADLDGRRKMGA
jgi:hypothetical protein